MKNADQPAFAQSFATDKDGNMYSAHEKDSRNAGLSKREYFAAMAMQGMLANSFWAEQYSQYERAGLAGNKTSKEQDVAEQAVRYADELLKQLES